MLTARHLYFEAVKVGDELPPLVKPPVDRLQIARYAAAAQDWNPLYIDEPFAKNAGFPSALAPGMIAMGFLAELAVDWVRGARLRKFGARFVEIVWPGDVLTARGRVVDRRFEEGGRYAMEVEVWAENQRGELAPPGERNQAPTIPPSTLPLQQPGSLSVTSGGRSMSWWAAGSWPR